FSPYISSANNRSRSNDHAAHTKRAQPILVAAPGPLRRTCPDQGFSQPPPLFPEITMTDDNAVILTARDFTLLENLVHSWGEPFPGASEQIRRKLDQATVVFHEDLPPGVVALNSRVRFRVGTALAE